jgi:hypothetical protein
MGTFLIAANTLLTPSNDTVRGKLIVRVSASVLRKERIAATPSAFRKAVAGVIPPDVFAENPGPAEASPATELANAVAVPTADAAVLAVLDAVVLVVVLLTERPPGVVEGVDPVPGVAEEDVLPVEAVPVVAVPEP